MERDILDALARIVLEFRSLNLEPPAAVILADHEEGLRVLRQLSQRNYLMIPADTDRWLKPVEHPDGSVWMEIEAMGIKLRWPAKQYALPNGGYRWV